MKKFYLLLILLIAVISCEKEEMHLIDSKNISNIETVSKADINNFIKSEFNSSKKSGLTLYPEKMYLDTLKNSEELLTIIPAQSKYSNEYSRVLLLKVNGEIKHVAFNMISTNNETDKFTGRIIVTTLDGDFLNGYRLEDGKFKTQFVLKDAVNKADECDPDYGSNICENALEEVVITAKPQPAIQYVFLDEGGNHLDSYDWQSAMTEPTWDFSGGTTNTFTTAPIQITNLLTGKARCAFDKLRYGNVDLYNKTIGVFDNNDYYNLTVGYGSCNNPSDDACTNGLEIASGCVSINFQSTGLNTLDLAALILHEGIHAEIYKYVYEYQAGIDPNNRKNLLYWYFAYKAQNGLDVATREAQHQYMADNYVSKIANAIRDLDNKQYSLDYYMGFAWDGLRAYGWDGYYDKDKWVLLPKKDDWDPKRAIVLSHTKFNNDCNL